MQQLSNFQLPSKHQLPILVDIFYNKTQEKKPLVIFCHGYKGYKDWGAFGEMHKQFTEADTVLLSFNFSHNGGTPAQPIDFPDLEAFGHNNYSKELEDLQSVLDWICNQKEHASEIDTSDITLIGHSRGGGIATLTAASDARIKKLATWASVSTLDRSFFHGPELVVWKKNGVVFIENGRTKQQMPHYIQFYEDYKANEAKLSVETAAKKLSIPHLIVHGDGDLAVPFSHAENLHRWNPDSKLVNIKGANHVFGVKQPWTAKDFPEDFTSVLTKTLAFIAA